MDFLDNLRKRSPYQRNLISLLSAFVITGGIASVWFVTERAMSDGAVNQVSVEEGEEESSDDQRSHTPFATLKDSFDTFVAEAEKGITRFSKEMEAVESFEGMDEESENSPQTE